MRSALLVVMTTLISIITYAQSDSTLQQYTGKFKFPEGSAVSEVTITVEKGVLTAVSSQGSSELRATQQADVFDIVAYSGTATYRRTDGKITGIQMIVGDIILEGTKSEGKPEINYSRSNFIASKTISDIQLSSLLK